MSVNVEKSGGEGGKEGVGERGREDFSMGFCQVPEPTVRTGVCEEGTNKCPRRVASLSVPRSGTPRSPGRVGHIQAAPSARLHVVSLWLRTQELKVTALPPRPLVHASAST